MAEPKCFINYDLYINSRKWKAIRKRIFKLRGKKCEMCGSRSSIHVHHLTYKRFGGDELDEDLLVVCSECHHGLHPDKPKSLTVISKNNAGPRRQLKDRIKATKKFLQFGGRDKYAPKCPTCEFVISKPVFKIIPGGRKIPKKPELTCGIMQGLSFPVFENTYCKNHEPIKQTN